MSLINSKVELSLNWIQKCVLTTAAIGANADDTGADSATFKITDASKTVCSCCYFINRKQCKIRKTSERFKRPVYWNKYKVIGNKVVEIAHVNDEKNIMTWY